MHEAATVRLIRKLLSDQRRAGKKPVFLDVGTNSGMHLLAAASVADEVFGFEPWDVVRKKAERNISINRLENAKVFPFGLSDVRACLPFSPPDSNNLGVGAFMSTPDDKAMLLQVQRGDDVVSAHHIHPTLIKMDVEGHEKKALTGLQQTLRRYKPVVIFEYSEGSRHDLGNFDTLRSLFGDHYSFHGIKRSREQPALEAFNPAKKYENVLAQAR